MKKISVLIPTYNEEENVVLLSEMIINEFKTKLNKYDYEIIFIDNYSVDDTRILIQKLCNENKNIKAIFNSKNFGQFNSPYYGLLQTKGDCTILMCADFQEPISMISKFVNEWEKGYKVVIGKKVASKENKIMYLMRSFYYKLIKRLSDIEQIEHFTGFGLYDKSFINILAQLDDPTPFLRGIVAEFGIKRKEIAYEQEKRRAGKTNNNWYSLYDAAMLSFTSYTKIGLRLATILGFIFSGLGLIVTFVYLMLKLIYWERFVAGVTPILIGIFLFGSIQLFFIGLLGEYIMNMNTRIIKRPLVIEEKRINFEDMNKS
ncbi:glycosyltransferase family 2 protein [Clostridioides sp. ZZV14-6345]|uniref:glycosyltransferase family 2 protein n=1 Tax=Clostridioides sp. ZZV14-6345 TaxID=2811496 RepID=UPI001D125EAD|nr:glycosyltransferase family 2 protein [Clostridioides sp. ZZV14-6345]